MRSGPIFFPKIVTIMGIIPKFHFAAVKKDKSLNKKLKIFNLSCIFLMGNFCNAADFTLCLWISKFVTFVKRVKKASAEIF